MTTAEIRPGLAVRWTKPDRHMAEGTIDSGPHKVMDAIVVDVLAADRLHMINVERLKVARGVAV